MLELCGVKLTDSEFEDLYIRLVTFAGLKLRPFGIQDENEPLDIVHEAIARLLSGSRRIHDVPGDIGRGPVTKEELEVLLFGTVKSMCSHHNEQKVKTNLTSLYFG